jgi:hypothetical protein
MRLLWRSDASKYAWFNSADELVLGGEWDGNVPKSGRGGAE